MSNQATIHVPFVTMLIVGLGAMTLLYNVQVSHNLSLHWIHCLCTRTTTMLHYILLPYLQFMWQNSKLPPKLKNAHLPCVACRNNLTRHLVHHVMGLSITYSKMIREGSFIEELLGIHPNPKGLNAPSTYCGVCSSTMRVNWRLCSSSTFPSTTCAQSPLVWSTLTTLCISLRFEKDLSTSRTLFFCHWQGHCAIGI